MTNYFLSIKDIVKSKGIQIGDNKWKLENCTYEVFPSEEKIVVPGLVEASLSNNGVLNIINGSEDALKFLEASI